MGFKSRKTMLAALIGVAAATMPLSQAVGQMAQLEVATYPKVAVALGDSFVSGEGAEDFIEGDGAADYMRNYPDAVFALPNPLFSERMNTHPYSCHRSRNASIFVSNLPGIDERIMIACSGADPEDLTRNNPTFLLRKGIGIPRGADLAQVKPQLDELWRKTRRKDIDLILVGMGANNSVNNFSGLLSYCHAAFMVDAAGGPAAAKAENLIITEYGSPDNQALYPDIENTMDRNGCVAVDFYSQQQLNSIRSAYVDGLRQLILGMRQRRIQHQGWKLVVQGYASPFATEPDASFLMESGKRDDANRFAALARKRYTAGCPLHADTLAQSDDMAAMLSSVAEDAVEQLRNEFPDEDIVYLDVQRAFDGGRLCERADSPAGALWNPIWFRNSTDNTIMREIPSGLGRTFIGQWSKLALPCAGTDDVVGIFIRCQDSAHPNEDGQAVLARCLNDARSMSDAAGGGGDFRCARNAQNGTISVSAS